jgi:phosphoglycolate phosphatase-like HAD superfamily hydrolase
VTGVAIEVDAALGDTRPLWEAWLDDARRRLRVELDVPEDRAAAAPLLDAAIGNWRVLLRRFAEDHAPVYLRPNAEAGAALRRLEAAGIRIGAFTDCPEELATVALAHLGALRRIDVLETGDGALDRLLDRLGEGAEVVRTRAELHAVAA